MAEGERRRIGQRYELFGKLAAGGTATVHLGRLHGSAGFTKPIAIKRLHPHLAGDPALRSLLAHEARLVSRISHPNVVGVLDIVENDGELFLILEYVHGRTLAELLGGGARCAPAVAVAILRDALTGLHAAHHTRGADGGLLGLVHRDVSARNVIVTSEGTGKILDFGIAKASSHQGNTGEGSVRGSLPYMAPEQLEDGPLSPRTDVYGASVVLWEALTGERLFSGDTDAAIVRRILDHDVRAPSAVVPGLPRALDAVVLRGLARDPSTRFGSGLEMALALAEALAPAPPAAVGEWVSGEARDELDRRQALLDSAEIADAEPVATAATSSRARSPLRVRAWMMAVALVLALLLVRELTADRASGSPAALAAEPSTTLGAASPPRALPALEPEPTPATAAAVPSTAAIAASQVPSTAESAAPPRTASPPSVAPRVAPTPRATASAECAPYYVDANGIRRFNRECLE
jgi:eukaryotic-like serine/threonine-protein kinase